jgi:hypothetical protein
MTMDRFLLDYSEMSLEIADRGGLSKMDNLLNVIKLKSGPIKSPGCFKNNRGFIFTT